MTETRTMPTLADVRDADERIRGSIRSTPVVHKDALAARFGLPVHLKFEHLQRTGSFKIRGALNLTAQLTESERAAGVVAASAGNHAQGVAVAAAVHGISARIFMPEGATLSKVEATKSYGADVVLEGDHLTGSLEAARAYADEHGATFVHPFDDPRIIAGQGTIGLELVEQLPDLATLVIPIGGGGLFAGIASVVRELRPDVRIIGVQATACTSVRASLEAGHPVQVEAQPTMADGISVKSPGELTLPVIEQCMDELVEVSDDALAEAMLWLMERAKQVVEGAGAASLAALLSGGFRPAGPTCCVLSGGNIDPMSTMAVVRHGLGSSGRFVRITTTLPDRPGELSSLLSLLAQRRVNVLAVEHRREGEQRLRLGETRVDLTLQTRNAEHVAELLGALRERGYAVAVR